MTSIRKKAPLSIKVRGRVRRIHLRATRRGMNISGVQLIGKRGPEPKRYDAPCCAAGDCFRCRVPPTCVHWDDVPGAKATP